MSNEYVPNRWVVVTLSKGDRSVKKVLAGWCGGYTDSDSWKLSSGITDISSDEDYYIIKNASGSVYKCRKDNEGLTGLTAKMLQDMKKLEGISVEIQQLNGEPYETE